MRPARLLAALALAVLPLLVPAGVQAAGPGDVAATEAQVASAEAQVAALRSEVERTAATLTEGTARLEVSQAELVRVRAEQEVAQRAADAAVARATAADRLLQSTAAAAYRTPVPDTVTIAITRGPEGLLDAMVARAGLDHARLSQRDVLQGARSSQAEAEELLAAAAALAADAAARERELATAVDALRATAEARQVELTAAFDALEQARAARAAALAAAAAQAQADAEAARLLALASSGPVRAECTSDSTAAQPNGFLDPAVLCPLRTAPGHALVKAAAEAFDAMSDASLAERGVALCVTDSYRSYGAQVDVYARKPALAAIPGTSQHGYGLAVDLCGGVQSFGTEAYRWVKANSTRFGWVHPDWAEPGGSTPEPWHWEYVG